MPMNKLKKNNCNDPGHHTKNVQLKVTAELVGDGKAEDLAKAHAYVFSSGGKFLGSNKLDNKGTTTLTVSVPEDVSTQSVRVLVGPKVTEKDMKLGELLRRGSEQRLLRIDPKMTDNFVLVPIIPNKLLCWLLSACIVHGQVLKKHISGGVPIELPVCHATVEIYEVDIVPFIIKLPDQLIERFRDIIINPPPPLPPIDPPEIFPLPGQLPELLIDQDAINNARLTNVAKDSDPVSEGAFAELQFKAKTATTHQFRNTLVNNTKLIKPLICLLPWGTVKMDLVATTKTDACGKFKTLFFKGCNNTDVPDLYFKVKQKIFQFLPPWTIYAPTPVPCHTYWNYQCGTQEVILHVNNPFAITCPPCPPVIAPNNWVLVMAIGNLPVSRIRGASIPQIGSTTAGNLGLTDWDAPFGKTLRPRIEFDNSLRDTLGVKYYRLSYRKGTTGSFTPLTASINRHYTHEIGGDLVLEVFNLGPKVINSMANLFEIPPALPPIGQWSIPNAVEDTSSAKFQTLNLASLAAPGDPWPEHGKYQIKVDLFDQNGNLVDIDALNIKYRVPEVTDLSGIINTEDAAHPSLMAGGTDPGSGLVRDDDGDGLKSFIMTLHVDNSRCSATIPAPSLDGSLASDECGVMKYPTADPGASTVTMNYRPEYPNGVGSSSFATYQFNLYRGANQVNIPPDLPDTGNVPNPNVTISTTQSVSNLLGSCTIAGYSENLHVWAMATTGWSRISSYDSHIARAFVLAPEAPSSP